MTVVGRAGCDLGRKLFVTLGDLPGIRASRDLLSADNMHAARLPDISNSGRKAVLHPILQRKQRSRLKADEGKPRLSAPCGRQRKCSLLPAQLSPYPGPAGAACPGLSLCSTSSGPPRYGSAGQIRRDPESCRRLAGSSMRQTHLARRWKHCLQPAAWRPALRSSSNIAEMTLPRRRRRQQTWPRHTVFTACALRRLRAGVSPSRSPAM